MKKLLIISIVYAPCYSSDHHVITLDQGQSSIALSSIHQDHYALDAQRLSKFVSDLLPEELQESFIENVHAIEWQKFVKNFNKPSEEKNNSNEWYKETLVTINTPHSVNQEVKEKLAVQILARALIYRCETNKQHKAARKESLKKAQKSKKTSIASVVIGGIATIATNLISNLLQYYLSKK